MALPTDAQERKDTPIFSGVLRYFPNAIAYVALVSKQGNDQHHPGTPLHWDKSKSTDEGDALVRHQMEAGTVDADGILHSGKVAWRALAQLERELDAATLEQGSSNDLEAPGENPFDIARGEHVIKRSALDYFAKKYSDGTQLRLERDTRLAGDYSNDWRFYDASSGIKRGAPAPPSRPAGYSNEVEGP